MLLIDICQINRKNEVNNLICQKDYYSLIHIHALLKSMYFNLYVYTIKQMYYTICIKSLYVQVAVISTFRAALLLILDKEIQRLVRR